MVLVNVTRVIQILAKTMPVNIGLKAFIPFYVVTTIAVLFYGFWRLRRSKADCDSDEITDTPLDAEDAKKETMDITEDDDDDDDPSDDRYRDEENASSDDTKVFVSNISFQVRTAELKDFFRYFGHVTQVNLLRDRNRKRSRGLAFVTFRKRNEAEKAKAASDYELTLDGRVMKCSAAQRRPRRGPKDRTGSSYCKGDAMSQDVFQDPPSIQDGCDGEIDADDSLINTLPDDMLIKIFGYLNLKQRIRIESVCRRWRKACQALWLSQSILHFTNVFKGFSFSNEQVGPTVLTDAIFKSILFKGCYNLTHLDISASPRFLTTRSLNCIGQVCRELRSLNLTCSKVDNSSIKTITNGSRKIEKIILNGCQELGEKGIWWMFHNCENLYHVDLRENRRVNGKCFHILNKHCKTVLLDGCCSISDKGLDCLTAKCGDSLQELDLSGCMIVTDHAFSNMTERCKSLQVLRMSGVHSKVTSAGLKTLVNLTSLDTLHLTFNQGLSDAVLSDVSRHCTRLRELRIDGCSFQNITDAGIRALARCPCLEVLNISYHEKLTDEGIKDLALAGRLQKLVARSIHITDQAIRHLAAHCLRLYELDVCGCTALTISSVQVFLEAREAMTENRTALTLNYGGTAITEESLTELGAIDSSVTVCLQNFTAPPGQYYPSILPYDDRSEDSSDDSDEEEEELVNVDPLDDERPLLNLAAHLSFPLNRQRPDIQIEYLQVPADSDEPWDGVVDPEPAGDQESSSVVTDPGQSAGASQDLPWDEGLRDDNGILNQEPAGHLGYGPVVTDPRHSAEASPDMPWCADEEGNIDGGFNPQPSAGGEMVGPAGPGQFAHANPDLGQFLDVEEHLMAGDLRRGGDWAIAEEDLDDFLDADDPAYMNDIMFIS